ncbi:MAG: BtaA family protein, partial [Hyphomonadaceae bacterium]|nr:BtaA family protein [Hyphomonadaceae bacterium]
MSFATSLNFTSANEDGATELAALASVAGDRVLCLTASGTRPLDLLLGDASQIVALDMNPAQNRLLALKIAAIRVLEDDDL